MKKMACLLVLAILWMPAAGFAASPWADGATYGDRAMGKLKFGLKNLLLGWTDLFKEPHRYDMEHKNVMLGIGKGLVDTLANEVGGALHTVTFFIPQLDVPLPENGVQCKHSA